MEENMNADIVPVHLAVTAMRDNGYKNTAYAIAELMDNALQAKATLVELLVGEKEIVDTARRRVNIDQIAILDNGCGMNAEVLQMALQFGNGTNLGKSAQIGMGKFGMGLPASSISQCTRVEVWSWQNGVKSALYSYLDLDDISKGLMKTVPRPVEKNVPEAWQQVGQGFSNSGTLVVWSKIDRSVWKTGMTLIDHSEMLIGRLYRRFLDKGRARIRLVQFDIDRPHIGAMNERDARPNDPGYLMESTSTPYPYNETPMFEPYGMHFEASETIRFRDQDHVVKIRFSLAKNEARNVSNPGSLPYGKHAAKNVGVSLVRAERELDLDQSLVIRYDTRERWWGVEVDFPPALDEVFGVTNNKQYARNFSEIAKLDFEDFFEKGTKTLTQARQELEEDEDPKAPLISLGHLIWTNLRQIRELIKQQTKNTRSATKRDFADLNSPEREATDKTKERQAEGHLGISDADEQLSAQKKESEIAEALINQGVPDTSAQSLAASTVGRSLKYLFVEASIDSPAFFSVKPQGGSIIITLNTAHPAHSRLLDVLENDDDEDMENKSKESLLEKLNRTQQGLKLLLMAWARYEDEQTDGPRRIRAQEARVDWGRIAREFLHKE